MAKSITWEGNLLKHVLGNWGRPPEPDVMSAYGPGLQAYAKAQGASALSWSFSGPDDGFYFSLKFPTFSRECFVDREELIRCGGSVVIDRLQALVVSLTAVRNLVARSRRFKSRRNSIRWRTYTNASPLPR